MTNRFRLFGLIAPVALALPCFTSSFANAREYAPYVMYAFPAGAQRGTTVERMVRGRGLEGASDVRVSGKGVTTKVIAVEEPSTRLQQRSANRQDQAENPNVVRFSITVAADAEPGPRDLWIITPKGPTNRLKFIVGQVPEVDELDDNKENNELDTPQALESLPILVNGQIDQADRDIFRFPAKAGHSLVCELQGQSILPYIADAVPGWFQASLTLYDSAGNELAYVDDWRFRPDPVIIYKVEKDGEYMLEIKDVLFRGREDFVYRLSIGTLPFITHIYPLGGQRDTDAKVQLFGVNLPTASVDFAVPGDSPSLRHVKVNGGGFTSNTLPFGVGDFPESQEAEPNNAIDQAQKIETPLTINGRIQQKGDADYFVFTGKANTVVAIDARARRLESPLDSIITLFNATGGQLAENDDTIDESQGLITQHADSYLRYTIRADGDYVVRIGDIRGHAGGEEYAYRLTIAPPKQDFDLRVFPANLAVPQGASALAKVKAYRWDGFNGEINVSAAGLPPGFVAGDIAIGPGLKEARFTITAPPNAPFGIVLPTFQGKAKIGEEEIVRTADPAEDLMQAFYYRHDVPTAEMLLAPVELRSVALSNNSPPTQVHEIVQGGNLSVVVKASREGLKAALAKAEAEKKVVDDALAKVKEDVAKARADYDTAEKAAREAATAATNAKTAATRAATAQTNAANAATSKRQQATGAKKKLDDLVAKQQKPAESKLAAATKAVTDAAEDQRAAAEAQKKAAEQALTNIKNQVTAATTAYDAAEKAAKEAETAVANAKAEADKARAEQAAAEKAAPEKRKLADQLKVKRDSLPAVERTATTKVTEATKKVAAVKQAEKGTISLKADTPPRNITVKAANIPAGKNEATITITVAKPAPVGFRDNIILTASLKAGQETFTGVAPAIPIKVIAPPQ